MTMPKIDLHTHLDGSLSLAFVQSILGEEVSEHDLRAADDCRNLADYLSKFDMPLRCMQSEANLKAAAFDFMTSAASQGLSYVEPRFAPNLSRQEGLTPEQIIAAVLSGLEAGRTQYDIDFGLIICAMRHHSEADNRAAFYAARAFLDNGVVGGDLAGNEKAYPMPLFTELFSYAKDLDLPFTIHAGECGDAENVKTAILLGAKRIGHGIAMGERPDIIALCREKRVGVEMCPSSNFQTRAPFGTAYPFQTFLHQQLLLTINTDNTSVSNTSIDKEFQLCTERFAMQEQQKETLTANAIEIAFANVDTKHRLWKALK